MDQHLLELLRCPFCGTRLSPVNNAALKRRGSTIDTGVLGCECCAFPIVEGIPVLIANDTGREAVAALEAGDTESALLALLGLTDVARASAFRRLLARNAESTYRDALEILSQDAEGTYFVYRFSDPTYVTAETLVRVLGRHQSSTTGRRLDLCGGSGHLTRVLDSVGSGRGATASMVLADVAFWKLWLAARFTAPRCSPVCCDANHPLPFVRDTFQMVVLSDAFPYIWHKRLLADEMTRISGPEGVVVMPHLHSALGENVSAGDPLTPEAYRSLFSRLNPRLFSDTRLLADVVDHRILDLSQEASPEELGSEPALALIASQDADIFRRYEVPDVQDVTGELKVNPLYRVVYRDGRSVLTLVFPSADYEAEFRACRQYLPSTVTVKGDLTTAVRADTLEANGMELRRRRILLDLPARYY